MPTGTVKWFNATKGFGFIQPEDGGRDVFVHISDVERSGMDNLREVRGSLSRCMRIREPQEFGHQFASGLSTIDDGLPGPGPDQLPCLPTATYPNPPLLSAGTCGAPNPHRHSSSSRFSLEAFLLLQRLSAAGVGRFHPQ